MNTGFEAYQERRPPGLIVRFFETSGQFLGMVLGGGMDFVRQKKELGEHRSLWDVDPALFLGPHQAVPG